MGQCNKVIISNVNSRFQYNIRKYIILLVLYLIKLSVFSHIYIKAIFFLFNEFKPGD